VSAIPSEEIDPTGAGDAFAATFLAATVRGADARDALRRAAAAGALAVRKRGPMSGNSTAAEVDALLASS
jgi:sugar/nucleoside kinase (ribokinase family)